MTAREALPPLIRTLLRPSAYPHPTGRIRLIQTHISYVLLAGEYVYKIKKAVDFGFLNYSTLAKRRYYCHLEVTLNSRLCGNTYLGVVQLREHRGRVTIGGARGHIVEYAVQMRRLPAERMMDRLLDDGSVTKEMVRAVAACLVPFHESAETSSAIARYGDWAIRYNWKENVTQWTPYIGRTISEEQDRILRAYGEAFFARRADLLETRVRDLRIRRVHADLRSDAICFLNPSSPHSAGSICIFDCVEFSRRINLLDVARDVGFLAMDLDYRGRSDLADAFVTEYLKLSGDRDMKEILDLYKAYSACVRGKVESFLLDQPEVAVSEKRRARTAARRYFDLACRYAASLSPPLLVITCGLAGTGKSTLADRLAEIAGIEVVSSDIVRKTLAGLLPGDRRPEEFRAGIYSAEFTERTYEALLDRARDALQAGRSVILDATFLRRAQRGRARRLAREVGAQFACLQLLAPEDTARSRLRRRLRDDRATSDADWDTYRAQKRRFQRPNEIPEGRRIVVDAGRLRSQLKDVTAALRRLSPLSLPQPQG